MSDEVLHQQGVGVPDELDRLWTPHRMAYIRGENKPADSAAGHQCPFCRIPTLGDEDGLVVHRGELSFAVLNLYPYSPGHLMVCPYRHVPDYTELTDDETHEIATLTQAAMRTVAELVEPGDLYVLHAVLCGGAGQERGWVECRSCCTDRDSARASCPHSS